MSKFKKLVAISTISKLSDELVSCKTTLPWLIQLIGGPVWVISMLVPIREAGSLLPQWKIKQVFKEHSERLLLWRWAMFTQFISICLMPLMAISLSPLLACLSLLGLLAVMSVARAITSLCIKDIQAHHIAKQERGKMVGLASAMAGVFSLITAALLLWKSDVEIISLLIMLLIAAGLLGLAIVISKGLSVSLEQNHDSEESIMDMVQSIYVKTSLKHLIVNRCIMLHAVLVSPFYVSLTQLNYDNTFVLPYFIVASAIAVFLSAYIWGNISDYLAKLSLALGASICCVACLVFYFVYQHSLVLSIASFGLLTVGYEGIRNGRKTYALDIAEDDQRTQFIATANTTVGLVLIVLGIFYAILYQLISDYVIVFMSITLMLGVSHTRYMTSEK